MSDVQAERHTGQRERLETSGAEEVDTAILNERLGETHDRLTSTADHVMTTFVDQPKTVAAEATATEMAELSDLTSRAQKEQLLLLRRLDTAKRKVEILHQSQDINLSERIAAEQEYASLQNESAGSTALKIHETRQHLVATEAQLKYKEKSVLLSYSDKLNPLNWFKTNHDEAKYLTAREQYNEAFAELVAQECEAWMEEDSNLQNARVQHMAEQSDGVVSGAIQKIYSGYKWLGDHKFVNTALYKETIEPALSQFEQRGGKQAKAATVARVVTNAMNLRMATNIGLLGVGLGVGLTLGAGAAAGAYLGKRAVSSVFTYFGTSDGLRSARAALREKDVKAQIKGETSSAETAIVRYAKHLYKGTKEIMTGQAAAEITTTDLEKLSNQQLAEFQNVIRLDDIFSGKNVQEHKLYQDLRQEQLRRLADQATDTIKQLQAATDAEYDTQFKKTADSARIISLSSIVMAQLVGSGLMAQGMRSVARTGIEYGGKVIQGGFKLAGEIIGGQTAFAGTPLEGTAAGLDHTVAAPASRPIEAVTPAASNELAPVLTKTELPRLTIGRGEGLSAPLLDHPKDIKTVDQARLKSVIAALRNSEETIRGEKVKLWDPEHHTRVEVNVADKIAVKLEGNKVVLCDAETGKLLTQTQKDEWLKVEHDQVEKTASVSSEPSVQPSITPEIPLPATAAEPAFTSTYRLPPGNMNADLQKTHGGTVDIPRTGAHVAAETPVTHKEGMTVHPFNSRYAYFEGGKVPYAFEYDSNGRPIQAVYLRELPAVMERDHLLMDKNSPAQTLIRADIQTYLHGHISPRFHGQLSNLESSIRYQSTEIYAQAEALKTMQEMGLQNSPEADLLREQLRVHILALEQQYDNAIFDNDHLLNLIRASSDVDAQKVAATMKVDTPNLEPIVVPQPAPVAEITFSDPAKYFDYKYFKDFFEHSFPQELSDPQTQALSAQTLTEKGYHGGDIVSMKTSLYTDQRGHYVKIKMFDHINGRQTYIGDSAATPQEAALNAMNKIPSAEATAVDTTTSPTEVTANYGHLAFDEDAAVLNTPEQKAVLQQALEKARVSPAASLILERTSTSLGSRLVLWIDGKPYPSDLARGNIQGEFRSLLQTLGKPFEKLLPADQRATFDTFRQQAEHWELPKDYNNAQIHRAVIARALVEHGFNPTTTTVQINPPKMEGVGQYHQAILINGQEYVGHHGRQLDLALQDALEKIPTQKNK